MDERKTGSFHFTGAGQSGGVSVSEAMRAALEVLAKGINTMPCRPLFSCHSAQEIDVWWLGFIQRQSDWVREIASAALIERSAEPTRAGTERHTRNEPDPESGIRISPGSSILVERGMV